MNPSRRTGIGWACASLLGCLAAGASAGDLTTDRLTVNQEAVHYGDLQHQDASRGAAPTNGLVLYYSFATNAAPVPDDSGNGHTGDVAGVTWTTNAISGGAYDYDGAGTITVTGYKGLLSVPLSASLWFNVGDKEGVEEALLAWGTGGEVGGFFDLEFHPYAPGQLSYQDGTGPLLSTPSRYDDGSWHHCAVTLDANSEMTIYVDGGAAASAVRSGINYQSGADVGIGWRSAYGDCWLNGFVDEVRLYDRCLTPAEVHGLYRCDAHLATGRAQFEVGIEYVAPLGGVSMGSYTNRP